MALKLDHFVHGVLPGDFSGIALNELRAFHPNDGLLGNHELWQNTALRYRRPKWQNDIHAARALPLGGRSSAPLNLASWQW
jgi:hypothetical protein